MRWGALLLALAGCGDKDDEGGFGLGGDDGTTEGDDGGGAALPCEGEWAETDGIWVDPGSCFGWSELASGLTWHEAVSADEAADGGCDGCDESATDHCADLSFGGRSDWRLPDADALVDLSTSSPPFDELGGDLWSRTTDEVMTDLASTVDLTQPGQTFLLGKTSTAGVRCVVE